MVFLFATFSFSRRDHRDSTHRESCQNRGKRSRGRLSHRIFRRSPDAYPCNPGRRTYHRTRRRLLHFSAGSCRNNYIQRFPYLREFECTLVGPDGIYTHGAPSLFVDVVKGDGGALVDGLLLWRALAFGGVVGRDEVGAGSAAGVTDGAVFLDELKENDAFVEGFS